MSSATRDADTPVTTSTGRSLAHFFTALAVGSAVMAGWLAWSNRDGSLIVASSVRELAAMPAGTAVPLRFALRNSSKHTIRVIGANDRCELVNGCSKTLGLPLSIPAGESRTLNVDFKTGEAPYTYRLNLYTDDADTPSLAIVVSG